MLVERGGEVGIALQKIMLKVVRGFVGHLHRSRVTVP